METKKTTPRAPWAEIRRVYDEMLQWFYERKNQPKARRLCPRLEKLLQSVSGESPAILAEECQALLYEVRGDLPRAIRHREREISLRQRLIQVSRAAPSRELVLRDYGFADLSDRLDLLAILYHDAGDVDKAIHTLRQSQRLCKKHSIPFDGTDVLAEYLAERQRRRAPVNGRRRKPA